MRGPCHLSGDEVRAQGGSSLAKEKEYERRNAMSGEEVFPWSIKNETIETLHAQLQASGSDVSLQRLREIQLKLIKERDGIAEEESE